MRVGRRKLPPIAATAWIQRLADLAALANRIFESQRGCINRETTPVGLTLDYSCRDPREARFTAANPGLCERTPFGVRLLAPNPNARIRTGNTRRGFTLVELLVVITIIGILMSLLIPAVQSARESGRATICANNARQLAFGALQHVNTAGIFPSGGWGYLWGGDPDCGFGPRQPGGWVYSILPFIDQKNLWSLGSGIPSDSQNNAKKSAMMLQATTALAIYYCPSRRATADYPVVAASATGCYNISITGGVTSKCDYAINAGDNAVNPVGGGPATLAIGHAAGFQFLPVGTKTPTGISYAGSQIRMDHLAAKGASNEYLLGEKYLDPDFYTNLGTNGGDGGDNEWATAGWDNDTVRTAESLATGNAGGASPHDTPMLDTVGYTNLNIWGSPHSTGVHMAFCDGSVHNISFTIDSTTHANLANRNVIAAIDPTKVQ